MEGLAQRIAAALPQTQCQRCGYMNCAAYAQAIAAGEAAINQCPPGGQQGVLRLARITGQMAQPLNPAHGMEAPRTLAFIEEDACIGCTRCIQACPVDAILGAPKRMHTVIPEHCTGCELCLPACPVDCIALHPASGQASGWNAWSEEQARHAHQRYHSRQVRLGGHPPEMSPQTSPQISPELPPQGAQPPAPLADLLQRARARRALKQQPANPHAPSGSAGAGPARA